MHLLQTLKGLKNILQNRPVLLVFDVTKKCNQNCTMCNIKKTHSNDMTIAEIEIKAKQLSKFGILEVFIQGGEPLIRSDILEIVDIFIKNKITPTIITNGELLTKELAFKIANRKCNLAISIDSLIPETYSFLRGKDCLHTVLENIKNTQHIKRQGYWAITSTVSEISELSDLMNISEFAKENGYYHIIRPYNATLNNAGSYNKELEIKSLNVINILEYFKNKTTNIIAKIIYKEEINFLKNKKFKHCDALRYSMVMQEDGTFIPCIELINDKFNIEDFKTQKQLLCKKIEECNKQTPCIYGCTRNTGFLLSNLPFLIINIFSVIKTLKRKY